MSADVDKVVTMLQEERRARLEHALKSLEVEVVQRGELLADRGGWLDGWAACAVVADAGGILAGSLTPLCGCSWRLCWHHQPAHSPNSCLGLAGWEQVRLMATAPPASPSLSWRSFWRQCRQPWRAVMPMSPSCAGARCGVGCAAQRSSMPVQCEAVQCSAGNAAHLG